MLLLKNPSLEELKARASAAGRRGVPHLLSETSADGQTYTYLSILTADDVKCGGNVVFSAVRAAALAGDWALHFEVGLRDQRVWNDWCSIF